MNEVIIKDNIENIIYEIRGKQVMLDSDLAKLYECSNGTKDINKAVKRNIERFPEDFYFQLSDEEYKNLWFQNGTAKYNSKIRYLPYVFTKQGVAMLSTVLHTDIASSVSVKIMRAFVKMRKIITTNKDVLLNIETKLIEHDTKIDTLFDRLETKEKTNNIFFEGEIYDAYSLLLDILSKAKKEIIIIDNYASKELFDILKNIKVSIKIITKNIDDILIKKYKKQYNNIEIIKSDCFHDRFIIIDKNTLYHSGASFKDLGKKCFSINKIEDKEYLDRISTKIEGD